LFLLNRNFENARRVFTSAKELSHGQPPISDLIVLSYFLQGDYTGTIQAAKGPAIASSSPSAIPIILSYFAFHRLGRAEEAESYLRTQTAIFAGPPEDHLFFLELAGRLTTVETHKKEDYGRYYQALNDIKNGKFDSARYDLQELIKKHPKNDLMSFAAEIELERLGPQPPKNQ
jgi:hypothetical protein